MLQKFIEDGELQGTRKTKDGYLVAEVRCARVGIQDYAGSELDKPEVDRIRVLRPDDEVFSKDSLHSYAFKPATNDHPAQPVTADNWKDHAIGNVGGEIVPDGEFVKVPLVLMDAQAISDVESGKRQISMGYTMQLDFTPGKSDKHGAYDAVMRNLRMNHLAIVDRGRAGPHVRIGDGWTDQPTKKPNINDGNKPMDVRKIIVDGLTVETTDAGAQAVEKLQGVITTLKDAATTAQAEHDKALATKDAELAKKDKEITDLKAQVLDGAALDKLVADRSALVSKASKLVKDANFAGKSESEIKTATVAAVKGADFAADKSEAYINAAFDLLEVPEGTGDPVRDAVISSGGVATTTANDNGQAAYEQSLQNAWMDTPPTGAAN